MRYSLAYDSSLSESGFKDFQESREATSHPENPKILRILIQTAYRECHIQADWLLIYRVEADELRLVRTGSHAELFRE
jgi:addiction module RelE/StbE family toxin